MRRDDNADIYLNRFVTTDALNFSFFQNAQQLGLHGERHVADLVEKKGAMIRLLELAGVPRDCSGEGALFMSE